MRSCLQSVGHSMTQSYDQLLAFINLCIIYFFILLYKKMKQDCNQNVSLLISLPETSTQQHSAIE